MEKLSLNREINRNPLFDVIFQYQNIEEVPRVKIPSIILRPYDYQKMKSKFELSLWATERNGEIHFSFSYQTSIFRKETIMLFKDYFTQILSSVLKDPRTRLSALKMISQKKREKLLSQFSIDLENVKSAFI